MENLDILLNSSKKKELKEESVIKICYNKKWIIVIGVIIILLMSYIYYYNISIPTINIISNNPFKKTDKSCDDITELSNNDDDWNLENEIKEFMELQDNYIQLSK